MIQGELTRLRALTRQDLRELVEWRNDPEIRALVGGWEFPLSLEEADLWFTRCREDSGSQRLAIERIDTKEYIGNIGLYNIDWKNRKAECGILVGRKNAWGQGFGLDATLALLSFTFFELNLHRIFLHVLSHHKRAIRMYEKAGFKVEGQLREDNFRDGKYRDTVIMSILDHEFREQVGKRESRRASSRVEGRPR